MVPLPIAMSLPGRWVLSQSLLDPPYKTFVTINSMRGDAPFLSRILAEPAADGPRLVYADWLAEQGDPRGEYIRLQIALARLPATDAARAELVQRERALAMAHRAEWTRPFIGKATACTFRRGFVEEVRLPASTFVARVPELLAITPLRSVTVMGLAPHVDAIASCPALAKLLGLELGGHDLDQEALARFIASPHLRGLQELSICGSGLTDRAAATLARLRKLRRLDLAHNHIRHPGPLARAPALIELDLSFNEVTADGLTDLLPAPKLTNLLIHGNPLGDAGAQALLNAPRCSAFFSAHHSLNLSRCGLGRAAIQALALAPVRLRLVALDLEGNAIGDAGVRALVRSNGFDRLRALSLANNAITDDGATALARWELFPKLERLDLRGNHLSAEAVDALWTSERRHAQLKLNLADNVPPPDRIDPNDDSPIAVPSDDDDE